MTIKESEVATTTVEEDPPPTEEETTSAEEVVIPDLATMLINPFGTVEHFASALLTRPEFRAMPTEEQVHYTRILKQYTRTSGGASRSIANQRTAWRAAADQIGVEQTPVHAWLKPVLDRVYDEVSAHVAEVWTVLTPLLHDQMTDRMLAAGIDEGEVSMYTSGRAGTGGSGRGLRDALHHFSINDSTDPEAAWVTLRRQVHRRWTYFGEREDSAAVLRQFAADLVTVGVDVPNPAQDAPVPSLDPWQASLEALTKEQLVEQIMTAHSAMQDEADRRGMCSEYDTVVHRATKWPRRSENPRRRNLQVRVRGTYQVALTNSALQSMLGSGYSLVGEADQVMVRRTLDMYVNVPQGSSPNRYNFHHLVSREELEQQVRHSTGNSQIHNLDITSVQAV